MIFYCHRPPARKGRQAPPMPIMAVRRSSHEPPSCRSLVRMNPGPARVGWARCYWGELLVCVGVHQCVGGWCVGVWVCGRCDHRWSDLSSALICSTQRLRPAIMWAFLGDRAAALPRPGDQGRIAGTLQNWNWLQFDLNWRPVLPSSPRSRRHPRRSNWAVAALWCSVSYVSLISIRKFRPSWILPEAGALWSMPGQGPDR